MLGLFLGTLYAFPAHEQPVHTIEAFQHNEARLSATQYLPKAPNGAIRLVMGSSLDRPMDPSHWWSLMERLEPSMAVGYGILGFHPMGVMGQAAEAKGYMAHIERGDDVHQASWMFISRHPIVSRTPLSFGMGMDLEVRLPPKPVGVGRTVKERSASLGTRLSVHGLPRAGGVLAPDGPYFPTEAGRGTGQPPALAHLPRSFVPGVHGCQ